MIVSLSRATFRAVNASLSRLAWLKKNASLRRPMSLLLKLHLTLQTQGSQHGRPSRKISPKGHVVPKVCVQLSDYVVPKARVQYSSQQCEARIWQCKARISWQKRKACVRQCQTRVSHFKAQARVQWEPCLMEWQSKLVHTHVLDTQQPQSSPFHIKLGLRTLNLQLLKDSILASTYNRSKGVFSTMFLWMTNYRCAIYVQLPFSHEPPGSIQMVSKAPTSKLSKRVHSRRKRASTDVEYPKPLLIW